MNVQYSPAVAMPTTKQEELRAEWRTSLLAVNPFIREDALDLVLERMADALDTYLFQPIEAVETTDKNELLKAQGKAELLKEFQATMHIFTLCEPEQD